MDEFGFNNMSDDEFRKEFIRILNMYQSGMSNFMRDMYGQQDTNSRLGFMRPMNEDDFIRNFFSQMPNEFNEDKGLDDNGSWESKNWSSPDGSRNYRYYKKNFFGPEDRERNQEMDTVKLLESKLNKAIQEEKYEDAAKIRDLIISLKPEDKKNKK